MTTISTDDLSLVSGGAPASPSCNNDALLTTLQGIQSSLKDLGNNNNQGLFGGNSGLLFMTMALAMQRRQEVVVYGRGGCGGAGWGYRYY